MRYAVVLVLLVFLLVAAGCGSDDESSTGGTTASSSAPAKKKVRIGWFGVGPNTFIKASTDAAEAVASKDGAATLEVLDPNFKATTQFNQIQNAVTARKYDAIIVNALDASGVVPAVKSAIAAGIPVIADNSPIGPRTDTEEVQVEGVTGSVLLPASRTAQAVADLIGLACEGKSPCKVGFVSFTGSTPFDRAAFDALDALQEKNPDIKIVGRSGGNLLRDASRQVAQNYLTSTPDIDVIATLGDQAAAGAELAVKAAGKAGKVAVTGAAASAPGVEAVRAGRWFGTTISLPGDEGTIAMEMAIKAARDEPIVKPAVNPVEASGLPSYIYKANLDEFADFAGQWEG